MTYFVHYSLSSEQVNPKYNELDVIVCTLELDRYFMSCTDVTVGSSHIIYTPDFLTTFSLF